MERYIQMCVISFEETYVFNFFFFIVARIKSISSNKGEGKELWIIIIFNGNDAKGGICAVEYNLKSVEWIR